MKKLLSVSLAIVMLLSCVLSQAVFVIAADDTVDYNNAPYAGVYQVTSDKAVTLTNETGHTVTLEAGATDYFYLIQGANNMIISDDSANLTFTALDGNGLDYISEVTMTEEPILPGDTGDQIAGFYYVTLTPGATFTTTYTPNVIGAGLVYPYIAPVSGAGNSVRVTTDTGYYADIYLDYNYSSSAWADAAHQDPEMLYVRDGEQEITIENIGSSSVTFYAVQMKTTGVLAEANYWKDQMNMASLKVVPYVAEPEATPTPEPTLAPDTISYKADAAGIYEVTSDADVVLESGLGSRVELAAGEAGYIFLARGTNKIATSDLAAELTFTAMDNNGLDYIEQIETGTLPMISGQEDLVQSALNKELAPGEVYTFTYTPSKGMAGFAYPYIYMSDTNESTIRVVSDTGFYTDIAKPAGNQGTLCWADAERMDFEFLYIKAGTNVLSIENIGANPVTLATINIHSAGELASHGTWGSQITLDNLKVYTGEFPSIDYGYFPQGWDGTLENHPDYDADSASLLLDAYAPNMSSEEGTELYGTDFGWGDTSPDVMNKGQSEGIYLPAGSYATFTLQNAPYSGTYTAMIRTGNASGQTANVIMSNDVNGETYYADFPVPSGANWIWAWSYGLGIDDFMYLKEGTNHITVYNQGPGGVVYYNNSFGALNNQEDYFQYVGTADDQLGSDPEGWIGHTSSWPDWANGVDWNNGEVYDSQAYGVCNTALTYDTLNYMPPYSENGINLSDKAWVKYTVSAPEAGMYLAVADNIGNTLHLETETGDYADFEAGSSVGQYIYLEEGDNIITATGNSGCEFLFVDFYRLNNSENYESQRLNNNVTPTEPFDLTISPYQDMKSSEGGWDAYAYDLNENAIVQHGGSVVKYELDVMFPGIYRVQARIGGTTDPTNLPIVTIDTDAGDGYRAQLSTVEVQDYGEWRATDANGAYQYVYLKEGINQVEITAGSTHHVLWSVEFRLLTEEEKASITIDDCKKTPPKPIVIKPYTDSLLEAGMKYDYHLYHVGAPVLGEAIGTELVEGEWQRFEVTPKVAGTYRVSTVANVYDAETTISVETKNSIGKIQYTEASGGYYKNATGGYITLEEGVNSVWVRNDGPGWVYLQSITLEYVEDTDVALGVFVQAHNYIGRDPDIKKIPEYTVRNNYYGIHVADASNTTADTLTYQYNVTIPADDYYGLIMTGTVPLTPYITMTLSDGVNDDIILFDELLDFVFGNENQAASVTITDSKVYIPAGEYVMTLTLTENDDAGSNTGMMTHIHGFEFTTLTRQDLLLTAMQTLGSAAEIPAILREYSDILKADIGANPETDFIYPEYAYNALFHAAMLPSGSYETYDDVKAAYDFAKNMISVSDDGSGNLVYNVQVADWNPEATVVVAVYSGEKLYMLGDGYLTQDSVYADENIPYVTVEAVLWDYIPEVDDEIKVFIWDSFDGLKPIF